ncbi:3-hydroxyacyl-CoA dehydrogenase family protein, partial [Pseudomonas putida]|nr:3-hydroxyacyl-CoA dehydrogenase family protein [Pseudomonas putida]
MYEAKEIPVGVVGLGLMGCSICTCLLMAGHDVVAVAPIPEDMKYALTRITSHLEKSQEENLVSEEPSTYLKHLSITDDYTELQ